MFSPNQLYDYLRYYCYTNKKNATLLSPLNIGSKKLTDFNFARSPYIAPANDIVLAQNGNTFREYSGCITMYDQEPLDINAYFNNTYAMVADVNDFRREFELVDFVCSRSMAIYTPIAAVSEVNSNDVNVLRNNQHEIFYFWSNALTSRYWYSHYELLTNNNTMSKKRIGCYIRDTTGTRKYRKQLLEFFKTVHNVFCPALISKNTIIPSDASASIVWSDCDEFDIQIVPETIFNTEKIHLTEKIFKPIVMFQPFILLAGPNSLSYLKHYGFKTFNELWDETYDYELDASKRLDMVIALTKTLLDMEQSEYNAVMEKAKKITEFNRNYFYSDKFKKRILNELQTNLDNALGIQEDNFYKTPGGTLFYYYDIYFKKTGNMPRSTSFNISIPNALEYAYSKSKNVGDAIVKKYKHLL